MFNKLKTSVGDLAGRAGDLKNLGVEAIQSTVAEFNAIRPLFARVGYKVGKVQLEIGLTPKLIIQLQQFAGADDAEFDALLAEHQGNKVLTTLVSALRQASALQARIKFQGMRFAEVEVELGIPPAIKLTFKEEGAPGSGEVVIPAGLTVPAPPPPLPGVAPVSAPPADVVLAPPPPSPSEGEERQKKEDLEAMILAGLAVRFTCQGCGKSLVVRAQHAGREGECRRCGTVHVIPAPGAV